MNKTIILLAAIAIFGAGIWFFVFTKNSNPTPAQVQTQTTPLSTLKARLEETSSKFTQENAEITNQQKENGCIELTEVEAIESETGNKVAEKVWKTISRDGICAELIKQKEDLQDQRKLEIGKIQKEIDLLAARPEQERAKAIQAIRDFMDNPNLEFEYLATRSPSNFSVGIRNETYGNNPAISTGYTIETPKEWERKAEIYQQKEYIGDTCQVYEYEIDPRNNQIIQVSVRYPETGVIANPKTQENCASFQSLETPLLALPELKETAISYIKKGVKKFDEIKDKLVYEGSTENPKTIPAQNTWFYQNKDYKLPNDLTAQAPSEYPTIRATVTSGGYLMMYLNTTGLFQ